MFPKIEKPEEFVMTTSDTVSQSDATVLSLMSVFPDRTTFRKREILEAAARAGIERRMAERIFIRSENKSSFGMYSLGAEVLRLQDYRKSQDVQTVQTVEPEISMKTLVKPTARLDFVDHTPLVPMKDPAFVQWGEYNTIKKIVASKEFFPIYISGMSGLGKTTMIKHICASLNREYIRVQINPDTDEMDLIGSLRLADGSSVWQEGPVVAAMKAGAILMIDECDRGSNKTIMSLQGVLEGEPILIKKTGEQVYPAKGFNVIATGNTKGRGSLTGRYTAAMIVDEAFLERFPVDIEQEFPSRDVLVKIMKAFLDNTPAFSGFDDKKKEKCRVFAEELASWGDIINKSFSEDAIDETLSIRRLVSILKAYTIFFNELKVIRLGISRFDEVSREAFIDLYRKISTLNFNTQSDEVELTEVN